MATRLPRRASVIVIGGGVIGCSVAYHLARAGVADVTLLERRQLTSGTTWHAAGLVGQLRTSINMTELARYTSELYLSLEAETGQATGYRRCGSISIATDEERLEELRRSASMAKVFGLEVNVVTPADIAARVPMLHTADVLGGIHIPSDGYANAVDVTNALARGARAAGARLFENLAVTAIRTARGSATGVTTEHGDIDADCVVLCTGMWTRELAATVGVNVPLHACEHYYALFESVAGSCATTTPAPTTNTTRAGSSSAPSNPTPAPGAWRASPRTSVSTRSPAVSSISSRSSNRPWCASRRWSPRDSRRSSAGPRVSRRMCAITSARRPNSTTVSWRRG
ncbi:MAG: FAD-binding oxidoreductase [Pseudomonadales bacterium]|nr:FAD-binding oxidoreductase [Pseudomonadales bacterium]